MVLRAWSPKLHFLGIAEYYTILLQIRDIFTHSSNMADTNCKINESEAQAKDYICCRHYHSVLHH